MTISDKSRKLLWGRSGNRCAICRVLLTTAGSTEDTYILIGEECHIVSNSPNGPRGNAKPTDCKNDDYDNLILLCPNHHKLIDSDTAKFTVETLKSLKRNHESFIESRTKVSQFGQDVPSDQELEVRYLVRISSGRELWPLIFQCEAFSYNYDEPDNRSQLKMFSEFLQNCQDYGDIGRELGAGEVLDVCGEFSEMIKEIQDVGYFVFGGLHMTEWRGGGLITPLRTMCIRIVRNDNPEILKV